MQQFTKKNQKIFFELATSVSVCGFALCYILTLFKQKRVFFDDGGCGVASLRGVIAGLLSNPASLFVFGLLLFFR
jgi:hypothetical protein